MRPNRPGYFGGWATPGAGPRGLMSGLDACQPRYPLTFFIMSTYHLFAGPCLDMLRAQPTGSVRLHIVDSPYGNTDLGFDKQPPDWSVLWPELERTLAPDGTIICFACEDFTLDLIASNRTLYRYRRVWVKSKGSRYLDKGWRPMTAHEDLVVFQPNPKAAVYNPQKTTHTGPRKHIKRKAIKQAHYQGQRFAAEYKDDGTRYPTTVMYYPSVGTTADHFNPTAKPLPLLQELVETHTNTGDNVCECFAGDAPAGRVCLPLGRRYVGAEINPEQHAWSLERLRKLAAAPTLLSQLAAA
jgi:site-specific DNA-methyltransferase (adenine-specific)